MIDAKYEHINLTEDPLAPGEYENCEFINCNFSEADLSGFVFIECQFLECNLTNVKLSQASFREVRFQGCKMVGLRFEECVPFLVPPEFHTCILKVSSFVEMKMAKVQFVQCDLREVDFSGTDLSSAQFVHSDLHGAVFDRTILEKADLSSSYHYSIDPNNNRIRKAVFSVDGLPGLLGKYDIVIR
ncbi:MAG TPA: pentapeptide repeat-containing protein [Chitinophagaceae bacterium]|nr:pentapeptide repeat-containing protein [Chitinophagaceae bacterium]